MSSELDLERLLREARKALPDPDAGASRRAREDALAAARRHRPRRLGVAAISVAGFLAALALGVGIGVLVVPSGRAAKDAVGIGFLPGPGWTAFQTGRDWSPIFQTVAVASNVPLDPGDQVAGAADPSGLPYATLQKLPTNGVVIVASFTRLDDSPWLKPDAMKRTLPLRLGEATRYVRNGTQVRPADPLGEWEIRAVVNGHYVDVIFYFGTPTPSAALRADADRQLARLVVQRVATSPADGNRGALAARDAALSATATGTGPTVVERTLSCTTGVRAGVHVVYVGGQSGLKEGNAFKMLAQAYVTTAGPYQPQLVAMTAGYPAKPPLTGGGVGYDGKRCTPVRAKVPLTTRGLEGGVANHFGEETRCFPPGKVLIHFRVVFAAPPMIKVDKKSRFYNAVGRIKVGQMAVRTSAAKPLAYLDVVDSGTGRTFTAKSCF